MEKDNKILLGAIVGSAAILAIVVGVATKPVVKTVEVTKTVVVTPTASPSATLAPLRGRVTVTRPVATVTPLKK